MLAPDDRALYSQALQAPAGYRFEGGVATTYTLDLETLLVLPFTLATQRESDPDDLARDPVALLEALRRTTDRLAVFHHEGRIHLPASHQALFGLLEGCVVPVRAAHPKGVFHPKLWVLRFVNGFDEPLLRVVVLSRNLTFDRSWDTVLVLDGVTRQRRCRDSFGLAELVETLPELVTEPLDDGRRMLALELAEEIRHTQFDAPEPFVGRAVFHAIGLDQAPFRPEAKGPRVLAISPFLSPGAIREADALGSHEGILVSREDELNRIAERELEGWEVHVLADAAQTGDTADAAGLPRSDDRLRMAPPDGLHAKLLVVEHGWNATWYVGSANLSSNGWKGRNIELMVELTGRRKDVGIDRFLDGGFHSLLAPYVRSALSDEERAHEQALDRAEAVRDALLGAGLHLVATGEGDAWDLELRGRVRLPHAATVRAWPVSLSPELHGRDGTALTEGEALRWQSLAAASLSAIVGFSVTAKHGDARATVEFAVKLPHEGFPDDRDARILRQIVQSKRGFFRYLRLLLSEMGDELVASLEGGAHRSGNGHRGAFLPFDEVVFEDLVRALSREPARLDAIDRLITDLRDNPDFHELVPEDFLALWETIREVRTNGGVP